MLFASAYVILLSGCANQGPSPEEQTVNLDQQREAERQQAAFRATLPQVTNPGRDQ